jgi:hypothetical protein
MAVLDRLRIAPRTATSILALLILAMPLAAVADAAPLWLEDGADLAGKPLYLAPVTAAGPQVDDAVLREVQDALRHELVESGALDPSAPAPAGGITLQCRVMRYAPGSVGGRWLGGRFGAAYIVVRAMLLDASSRALLGDMLSVQEISAGGLFSVGAEHTVVGDAAREIAASVAQALGRSR